MWWYGYCVEAARDWVVADVVVGASCVVLRAAPKCLVEEVDAPVDALTRKNKWACDYSHLVCGSQTGR